LTGRVRVYYEGHSLMWQQNYTPLGGSLWLSAVVAALPIFTLLYLLGL